MFRGVTTVAVHVTDLDRALRFWVDVLGFEERVRLTPDLAFLRTPNGELHVYLAGGCEPSTVGPESVRLGFYLEAEACAAVTYERLRAAGADLLDEAPEEVGDGTSVFRLRDPDGNVLDVVGK